METHLLKQLAQINWQPTVKPSQAVRCWLDERQSMTKRLERHCLQQVIVVPQREKFIDYPQLLPHEQAQLAVDNGYWLREVIMYGDGKPWIVGRTLVPKKTLDNELGLQHLGSTPLGRYLFSSAHFARDNIYYGQLQSLWARYSTLRLADNPLLLTELFLADSPAYLTDPL